jgi:hypothetical protein
MARLLRASSRELKRRIGDERFVGTVQGMQMVSDRARRFAGKPYPGALYRRTPSAVPTESVRCQRLQSLYGRQTGACPGFQRTAARCQASALGNFMVMRLQRNWFERTTLSGSARRAYQDGIGQVYRGKMIANLAPAVRC